TALFPATGFLEMGMAAARQATKGGLAALENVTVHEPLVVPESGSRTIQVSVTEKEDGGSEFRVWSLEAPETDAWRLHASGDVLPDGGGEPPPVRLDLAEARARCVEARETGEYYERIASAGVAYGPTFR